MNTIEFTDRVSVLFDHKHPAYETKLSETVWFNELDIKSLVDLITRQYHFTARENIVFIYDLAQKVFTRHGHTHPELATLVEALFLFFHDLLFHLQKKEQILFPNIIQLKEKKLHEGSFNYSTFGVIKAYTLTMQGEHKKFVKQLTFFRQVTDDYRLPADSSKPYERLFSKMKEFENEMIEYIQLENNFLFPRAIEMDEKISLK